MPTVTYISDIHLEFYKNAESEFDKITGWNTIEHRDILCLAGDIGYPSSPNYKAFLAYCSEMFRYVFVITGNHEYYQTKKMGKTITMVNDDIKEICNSFKNVHFLSESSFYVPEYDVQVMGTTLWTDTDDVDYTYNDFTQIYNMSLPGYMKRMHEMSLCYLTNELDRCRRQADGATVLVMTHHMPSFDLIAEPYKGSECSHFFASHLHRFIKTNKIDHWICGHSHIGVEKKINQTNVWMNPIGYPGEHKHPCWIKTFDLKNNII
jgi:predicted phosphohydrolase